MTEYFEVQTRDAAARCGELRLTTPRVTPALVDDITTDAGSLWTADRSLPDGDPATLTILPHRALPPGTDDPVETAFNVDYPDVDYPSAAVVSPTTAAPVGADAYLLAGAPGYIGHAEAYVDAIIALREAIPDDTALYLPGVATPANAAILIYSGVDLLDERRARAAGLAGRYLTTDSERRLEDLDDLPCHCPTCHETPVSAFTPGDCADHNAAVLHTQLARIRGYIKRGQLRDYIEGQARHEAWLTAVFRRLDQQYNYLETRTPIYRQRGLRAATDDTLRRIEIQRYADRVTTRYQCRLDAPLVILPCSARKPYSDSQSHRQFMDAIQYRGHIVSMTSPIGVVPSELETTYPAQQYDSVVTGRWTETEIDFVATVLEHYLSHVTYDRHIAHVPPGGYQTVCERVEDALGIDFEYTVTDHPTTEPSLTALDQALHGTQRYLKQDREAAIVRGIADYQFGANAGDSIFGPDATTDGHYPKLRMRDTTDTLLATMVPQYGTLALTLAGATAWHTSDIPTKHVEIDAFVPHGSVLAPGIVDADPAIRPGDEVYVTGPDAVAVGRATTHGQAMVESTRGMAVDVRHCNER